MKDLWILIGTTLVMTIPIWMVFANNYFADYVVFFWGFLGWLLAINCVLDKKMERFSNK